MTFKVGVFGSAAGDVISASEQSKEIGRRLAQAGIILITGACSGLPYIAALEAVKNGGEVWGYSPAKSLEEHIKFVPSDDASVYKKIFYVPNSFPFSNNRKTSLKYRNVISTTNCDAGIIISGRWGSLNEFTDLIDMGKIVGVLTGTGGIADELKELSQKIRKEGVGQVLFDSSPTNLVKSILHELSTKTPKGGQT